MTKKRIIKNVKMGDTVIFTRKGLKLEGTVIMIRENSVMVSISEQDSNILDYATTTTVVNHSNYTVISNAQRVIS